MEPTMAIKLPPHASQQKELLVEKKVLGDSFNSIAHTAKMRILNARAQTSLEKGI